MTEGRRDSANACKKINIELLLLLLQQTTQDSVNGTTSPTRKHSNIHKKRS